jgi:hypothetical protein
MSFSCVVMLDVDVLSVIFLNALLHSAIRLSVILLQKFDTDRRANFCSPNNFFPWRKITQILQDNPHGHQ